MARRIIWTLLAVAMTIAASPAHAAVHYVGTCVKGAFPTIMAAIAKSAPNDRINVCPGTYPEQVTISIPLFLEGMEAASGTVAEDRAVITLPPNPVVNATNPATGEMLVAQILVQNVNPAGSHGVVIGNLTVDGSANPAGEPVNCSVPGPGSPASPGLVGIFYDATNNAPGTLGNIGDVTARNQQTQNTTCGVGIWVENDSPNNQSVIIQNNSVHDFDQVGIRAVTGPIGAPPTLTATIKGNFVHGGISAFDLDAENIDGTILGNIATGGLAGIQNSYSTISITNNTVAGVFNGIVLDNASTASSNNITNVNTAFTLISNVSPGPTIKSNTTKKTQTVLNYLCTANATVTSNTFSDSGTGFSDVPGTAPTTTNSLFNIDTITSGGCP